MNGTQDRLAQPVVSSDFWRDMQVDGDGHANGSAHRRPAAMVAKSQQGLRVG